jgi:hypothetical protein
MNNHQEYIRFMAIRRGFRVPVARINYCWRAGEGLMFGVGEAAACRPPISVAGDYFRASSAAQALRGA